MQQQSKLDTVDEKYKRTIVYLIRDMKPPSGKPTVFAGATHRTLDERIAEHRRQRVGLAWEILERGNFHIMIIHHRPCDTLREVLALSRSMRKKWRSWMSVLLNTDDNVSVLDERYWNEVCGRNGAGLS
jgi:hypothetical protein